MENTDVVYVLIKI